MKRTAKVLEIMTKVCNESPLVEEIMDRMRVIAEKENWTKEQWEQKKVDFLTVMYCKLALEHEEIKRMLMEDLYEELQA